MIDFVESLDVFSHEIRRVGAAEEIPVFPLWVPEPFGRVGVGLVEIEGLGGRDLVGEGEEGEADAAGFVVEVETL